MDTPTAQPPAKRSLGHREFIALMATMSALDAFSIDAMLPALNNIAHDVGIVAENSRQYVITALFLGFSIGTMIYGFVADAVGRRRPVLVGFCIYCVGSIICASADSFPIMLLGRTLQGIGAAGPYVLSVTIVRDTYQGSEMARIMSLIAMIFIGVPMIAPFVGQGILLVTGWRGIFVLLTIYALISLAWFWVRQPETLAVEKRTRLTTRNIWRSVREILTDPVTFRNLLGFAAVFGAFLAYLSTSQQVFQKIYGLGHWFPLVFASLASTFGISSYFNSRWVARLGPARLVHRALLGIIVASTVFVVVFQALVDSPPLWGYLLYIATTTFCVGLLFGNIMTLALGPMGHIAGSASSVITALGTGVAVLLATAIGANLDGNVYPVVIGFGALSAVAFLLNRGQTTARPITSH